MSKTIEELEKELHNAKASLSYHKNKNKNKGKPKPKPKGESPRAKANRLAANIVWNDEKKAMAHVVAFLTANDADYKEAFYQALHMPVEDVRELVKGHEDEVEKHIKVLQERREAKGKAKEAAQPQQLSLALRQAEVSVEPAGENDGEPTMDFGSPWDDALPQQDFDDAFTKMIDEAWPDTPDTPDTPVPVIRYDALEAKKVIPRHKPNYGDSEETSTAVPIKATTLRLAKEVVSELTGFEGLSDEQIVGHILNRYLQYNKDGKL